ncbi:hypothetical protein AAVH_08873 [Aphelenchoides avenae]|nr:hypothetical protein AAVH_08873 [Aphelenchus avenae]
MYSDQHGIESGCEEGDCGEDVTVEPPKDPNWPVLGDEPRKWCEEFLEEVRTLCPYHIWVATERNDQLYKHAYQQCCNETVDGVTQKPPGCTRRYIISQLCNIGY